MKCWTQAAPSCLLGAAAAAVLAVVVDSAIESTQHWDFLIWCLGHRCHHPDRSHGVRSVGFCSSCLPVKSAPRLAMASSRRLLRLDAAVEVVVVLCRSASSLQDCDREAEEEAVALARRVRAARVSSGRRVVV